MLIIYGYLFLFWNIKKNNVIVNFWKSLWLRVCWFCMMLYIKLYVKYMLLMNNFMIKVILCNKILLFVFVLYRVIGKLVFCFYFFYGSFICYFNIDNYKLDVN